MFQFAESVAEVESNIDRYQSEVDVSKSLQGRMGQTISWYAYKKNGKWRYAPSKWVGYSDIPNAENYLSTAKQRTGTDTEVWLRQWYHEVGRGDPDHDEMFDELAKFLARYGKNPKSIARINVAKNHTTTGSQSLSAKTADLLVAVFQLLDDGDQKAVARRLEAA